MNIVRLSEIEATKFPTGRQTKVIIGANSHVQAEQFVMGHVEIEPGGKVPLHFHEQEEVYYILSGEGDIQVGDEIMQISGGTAVYIPSNVKHELINSGNTIMNMVFVYSPAGIVSHWDEEKKGILK